MSFGPAVQGWHDFYVTAGAAAATLVGLLFVGLSLHIRVVTAHVDVRSLARVTLTDFFAVLLIALLLLAPSPGGAFTAEWLIGIAVLSLGLSIRPAISGLTGRGSRLSLWTLLARFGVSAIAYVAVAASAVLLISGDVADALIGLLDAVVLLLMVAVRNTWDLLVTVADRPR